MLCSFLSYKMYVLTKQPVSHRLIFLNTKFFSFVMLGQIQVRDFMYTLHIYNFHIHGKFWKCGR